MATKIYTNEFNNITRLWVKKDEGFTPDEQAFMKGAGMRPSKNPRTWFIKHDAATEAVIRNHFESNNPNETRYEDIDDNPLIDDKPKPKPAPTTTVSTPEGTFPAVYTDFTHRTNALDAACKAVRGLTREVKAHEIIAMAQEFEAYLRGE